MIYRSAAIALALFLLLAPTGGYTQPHEIAQDSPAGQDALKKGMLAAEQRQWEIAVRYFNEAHKIAPAMPEAVFDLGLAEAQITGRELRAIGWFEAYLALAPNAANGGDVRKKIAELDVRAEGNTRLVIELIKKLKRLAPITIPVAYYLAKSGDVDGALRLLDHDAESDGLYIEISRGLAEAERFSEAIDIAKRVQTKSNLASAYSEIILNQISAGRLNDAATLLQTLRPLSIRESLKPTFELVNAAFYAGQRDTAAALFQDAKTAIGAMSESDRTNYDPISIATAEVTLGQRAHGEAQLRQIKDSVGKMTSHCTQMHTLLNLASAENKLGRRQHALALMKEAEHAVVLHNDKHTEICPVGRVFDSYLEIEDWAGAKAWILGPASAGFDDKRERNDRIIRAMRRAAVVSAAKRIRNPSSSTNIGQAWNDYISSMDSPLFTDFPAAIKALSEYTPTGSDNKSLKYFIRVDHVVEELVNQLAQSRQLRSH